MRYILYFDQYQCRFGGCTHAACYFSAYYSNTAAVVSACAFAGFEKKCALSVSYPARYLPRGQGMFCLDDAKRLVRQPWQLDSLTAWRQPTSLLSSTGTYVHYVLSSTAVRTKDIFSFVSFVNSTNGNSVYRFQPRCGPYALRVVHGTKRLRKGFQGIMVCIVEQRCRIKCKQNRK